ncbi:hypothetical protein GCM10022408_02900 [Hymenobacter fastidiosus]|uniref:Uncharacterized protein n=1 Tax=Hymenobacter fastidiosus TaxID=486264 RepID=A0ABP7RD43_9BACT
MKLITERAAANGLLIILSAVVLFHVLVLLRVIPFAIVWGGRLTDETQLLTFETVSILLNLMMLTAVAVRAGLVKVRLPRLLLPTILWSMTGLFLANTVGNLLATTAFEKLVFTPLTLLLALFSLRLALSKPARPLVELPAGDTKR